MTQPQPLTADRAIELVVAHHEAAGNPPAGRYLASRCDAGFLVTDNTGRTLIVAGDTITPA